MKLLFHEALYFFRLDFGLAGESKGKSPLPCLQQAGYSPKRGKDSGTGGSTGLTKQRES
jgi:hypothetical protein